MAFEGTARGDPWGKIRRAEEHLGSLDREIERFVGSKPYRLATQADHQCLRQVTGPFEVDFRVVCSQVDPIPASILFAVGDFLTNTRAALDHFAWNLVLDTGGQPNGHTTFPIRDSPPRQRGTGELIPLAIAGGPSPEAMVMAKEAQPYSRTDGIDPTQHPLWILDRLVGIDKHRHPVLCLQAVDTVSQRGTLEVESGPYRRKLDVGTLIAGFIFAGTDVNIDLEITTAIELIEGEPGSGEPLGDLCETLLEAVRSVINGISSALGLTS